MLCYSLLNTCVGEHMGPEDPSNKKKYPSFLLMSNFRKLQEDSNNVSLKIGSWKPKKLSRIFKNGRCIEVWTWNRSQSICQLFLYNFVQVTEQKLDGSERSFSLQCGFSNIVSNSLSEEMSAFFLLFFAKGMSTEDAVFIWMTID